MASSCSCEAHPNGHSNLVIPGHLVGGIPRESLGQKGILASLNLPRGVIQTQRSGYLDGPKRVDWEGTVWKCPFAIGMATSMLSLCSGWSSDISSAPLQAASFCTAINESQWHPPDHSPGDSNNVNNTATYPSKITFFSLKLTLIAFHFHTMQTTMIAS